ncbi:MAG: hypothetical protein ACUVTU_05315 [Desulfurispora sp.]|uniref:hypothetical protein n=1 Tax=Desulfurispora sp. TaxID=3014275 RepID=UPI00404B2C3F
MQDNSPYALFLILILLLLASDPQIEQKFKLLMGVLEKTSVSLSSFQAGIRALNVSLQEIYALQQQMQAGGK